MSRRRRISSRMGRHLGRTALDAQVGVSDFMVRRVRQVPHVEPLVRIYNGVDTKRFRPLESSGENSGVVFGFAGRLTRGKGVEMLVRALAMLPARPPLTLLIAGDGPLRPELESRASAVQQHKVEFLGWVTDMPTFWNRCHVALVPSGEWTESFCVSAAEAMACGRPVIATANGAVPEVVRDEEAGRILQSSSPAAWAAALQEYASSPELRAWQGLKARERAEEFFDISETARGYADLIDRVTASRRKVRSPR